jgi:hypothetical protein
MTGTEPQTKQDQNDTNKAESTAEDPGIRTLSFLDFFDDKFINGNPRDEAYQPLNNATEIQPAKDDSTSTGGNVKINDTFPESIYYPHKVTPLSPEIIKIIFEHREYNFDGIIDGIREYA